MGKKTGAFRPVRTGRRESGFRKGFVLGGIFGAALGVAAFSILPLAAFVLASLGVCWWTVAKVTTELNASRRGRLVG